MKRSIFFLLIIFTSANIFAQELTCDVQVSAPNLQTTDPQVFQTLQKSVSDFLNNRKWTGDNFKPQERIECKMLIQITQELGSNKYSAQLTVQSNRPVFDASYKSPVLNWIDKDFEFQYAQYQNLEYNENSFLTNLTSVLAYYAYIIIGYDYDTYSPNGGTPYFQKAQQIVNLAQSAPENGWKAYDSQRNRYWLVQNLLDDKKKNLRTVLYKYHREGLDKMYENVENGRKAIDDCLPLLSALNDDNPNSMVQQVFFQAKSDELVNIFSKATPTEKTAAVQTLSRLDASNNAKYQNILKSN